MLDVQLLCFSKQISANHSIVTTYIEENNLFPPGSRQVDPASPLALKRKRAEPSRFRPLSLKSTVLVCLIDAWFTDCAVPAI